MRRGIEEGLKRFATGLLKNVALSAPQGIPPYMQQQMPGMQQPQGNEFQGLRETLSADFDVDTATLDDGIAPSAADVLMVVDPSSLSENAVFAIDQFLMQGGTVVVSLGAYESSISPTSLSVVARTTGLDDWLAHHGIAVGDALVMDPRNAAFPVPVTRQVGGFSFQELQMLDYPYFVEVREDGFAADSPIVAQIPQATIPWASPIEINAQAQASRTVTELLHSSEGAWLSTNEDVTPRFSEDGAAPFLPQGETGRQLLGVVVEGRFDSYFADKESPLYTAALEAAEEAEAAEGEEAAENESADADDGTQVEPEGAGVVASVIGRSPESARIVLFGSNEFLSDRTIQLLGSISGTMYQGSLALVQNTLDWALEDAGLVSIRSRGHFNRTLPPTSRETQTGFEYGNYLAVLAGLFIVGVLAFWSRKRRRLVYSEWLREGQS